MKTDTLISVSKIDFNTLLNALKFLTTSKPPSVVISFLFSGTKHTNFGLY